MIIKKEIQLDKNLSYDKFKEYWEEEGWKVHPNPNPEHNPLFVAERQTDNGLTVQMKFWTCYDQRKPEISIMDETLRGYENHIPTLNIDVRLNTLQQVSMAMNKMVESELIGGWKQ